MLTIAIRYAIYMFLALSAYFILAHFLNVTDNYYFRAGNFVIQGICIWMALKMQSRTHSGYQDDNMSNFPSAVALGMMTSMFAYVPFAGGVTIYLMQVPEVMNSIRDRSGMGEYMTPFMTSAFILSEALIFSLIGTFIFARIIQSQRQPV